jgi:hypothetical protein
MLPRKSPITELIYQKKPLAHTDRKAKRNSFGTTLLSWLGILLAVGAIWQTQIISKQQQSIKGFETLLAYSSSQLDTLANLNKTLNEELKLLSKQLTIAEKTQEESNYFARIAHRAYAYKLYIASQSLSFGADILNFPEDSAARWNTYTILRNALTSQLDNPYLFENKVLFDNWMNCFDIITVQENIDKKNFYVWASRSEQKSTWYAWVRRVFDVSTDALEYSIKEINKKD